MRYLPVTSKNQNKDQTKGGDFIWSISKYSTLPYLQTKFDYTTVTMASLSTRQRFTTINELFDCGHDFLADTSPRCISR